MKKYLFLLLTAFTSLVTIAQTPTGYYDNATGKTGEELRSALHEIIKDHTPIAYTQIWNAFWSTDNKGNGVVWDMYSDIPNGTPPYTFYLGQGQCGEYEDEGDCYNREHSWPKSWFSGSEQTTPGRDLHHIFPTDGFVNAQRGSYPFGEVNNATWTSLNGSKLGSCKSSLGYSGIVFEPIDEYKGDFARAIMYMSVRYLGEDSDWGSSGMTNKSDIKPWAIAMLLNWNEQDPVSQKEIDRNNVIYTDYQYNRNPFVDHPEYARAIWDSNWTGMEYNISYNTVQHGSITGPSKASQGSTVTLTASPSTGYSLYSWYVFKTGDMNTVVYHGSDNTFTMPAFDVTVTATFVQGCSGDYYEKVTSSLTDWSGDYLIVNESNNKAFNGSLSTLDANNNTISVSISNNTISADDQTNAAIFTIASMTGGYSIKAASGKYIGCSSNSGLTTSNTALANTFGMSAGNVTIQGTGSSTLQYNRSANRFRYYSSSLLPIQLYKKMSSTTPLATPTHTIQFNSNGGSGTMNNQTVNEFESTQLNANTFQRPGFEFMGWNTQANGQGQYYSDGATVILLNDLILYAQWKQVFTITLATVQNGTVTISHTQATEGDLIELTATPDTGYELDHWDVTDAENHPISVVDDKFEMPASNVTVAVVFSYVGTFAQQYCLVTDVNQLVTGRKYLIVNTAAGKALSTIQNSNNRSGVDVTIANGTIQSIGSTVCELTLGGSTNAWTFFDSHWGNSGGYLYAASSSANQLRTQATNNSNGQWSVSITSDGSATIVAQGSNSRNHLRYNSNNGSPIFNCYASSNTTLPKVELYILSEEFDHTQTETIANLFPFDKHTVRSGATLIVAGTATCNNADYLILEEGAQFVHHTDNVKAMVNKTVTAYSDYGGWYTLSTPFTTYNPTEINSDNYDLYAYNEEGPLEWLNHKTEGFSLSSGSGYLYAHSPSTSLRMTGILNNGSISETVDLSYNNPYEGIRGFNLLGNPMAHEISFSKSENVSDGYYYLNNDEAWEYTTTATVPVGRGFLVKANATNQTVTLNPQSRGLSDGPGQFVVISIDGEKAYVKMNEGVSMPLLSFKGKNSSLWLEQDGKPYVMLVRYDADSIELNYKAPQQGIHQLCVNTENVNVNYLHLIDRLTGADIDLLDTPSYRFESHKGDSTSRFQLVFIPN